jgi:putative flavoprotein involved in K+ transport
MTAHHQVTHDPAGDRLLDVLVIGGSQSGLAIAWHLQRQGLDFVVLEAGPEVGHVWRSRWDTLKLFTPAQYDALPGMAFPAPADTYPTKDPVADYLQAYATAFNLPVRLNARVTRLSKTDDEFEVQTADNTFRARQVVVATGPFQVPFVPPPATKLDPSVTQVHSADYRNPQALPEGPVLVVGGGNSGFQIAEELAATRQVDLSIATTYPMLPQRLARPGPVLVADPAAPHARNRLIPARPTRIRPGGVRNRNQPTPAGAQGGPVPAPAGRRRGPHSPVRRP